MVRSIKDYWNQVSGIELGEIFPRSLTPGQKDEIRRQVMAYGILSDFRWSLGKIITGEDFETYREKAFGYKPF